MGEVKKAQVITRISLTLGIVIVMLDFFILINFLRLYALDVDGHLAIHLNNTFHRVVRSDVCKSDDQQHWSAVGRTEKYFIDALNPNINKILKGLKVDNGHEFMFGMVPKNHKLHGNVTYMCVEAEVWDDQGIGKYTYIHLTRKYK